MNFSKRSYQKELLDDPSIPFDDIRRNMQELNAINTHLGGHQITIEGIKRLMSGFPKDRSWLICEIGCGGADNLEAISAWARKKNIQVSFTGIDINPHCINVARTKKLAHPSYYILSDYLKVEFEMPPDIIFSSLFAHHFTDEQIVPMLHWMKRNASVGFFINDLHRHWLAYYSIQWITRLFSRSYLVKHDAPLSVQRGFSRKEWETLLSASGIAAYRISWEWAFRWLVVCRNQPTFP